MIKFFNQMQITTPCKEHGKHVADWTDACTGHDDLDTAVTCGVLMEAVLDGKCSNHELVPEEVLELTAFLGGIQNQLGVTRVFRIVKRTSNDEVIDA